MNAMFKKALLMLLALAMILSVAACGTKDSSDGASGEKVTVNIAFGAMANSLDPIREDINTTISICNHIYDRLIEFDANYNWVPSVAKSLPVKVGPRSWTIEIDLENHKFHNGDMLTMDDVVYSLLRIKDIPKSADTGAMIESVTYEGNVITITSVDEDNTFMPRVLLMCIIVSKSDIETRGEDLAVFNDPIGTGPYRVVEFIPGNTAIFETWDGYLKPKPQIDRLVFTAIPDNAARYIAVESGQIQYAFRVTPFELDMAKAKGGFNTIDMESNRVMSFLFNCEREPFDNVNVRRGIMHALNVDAYNALLGGRPVALSHIFVGFDLFYAPSNRLQYNLEEARRLLSAEGYTPDNPLRFSLLHFEADPGFEMFQADLRTVGVEMTLEMVEFSVYLSREGPGDFDVTWVSAPNRGGDALVDLDRYDYNFVGMRNLSRYFNPRVQEIIGAMRVSNDQQELRTLGREINEILANDIPQFSVYNTRVICVMDGGLTGVTIRPDMQQNFRNASYNP